MALQCIPKNVRYPVFKLSSNIARVFKRDTVIIAEDIQGRQRILDDLSMDGTSIGERRLHIEDTSPLSMALYQPKDVILSGDKVTRFATFIDSNGVVFSYRKTDWAKVKSYRIEKVTPAPTSTNSVILKLRGVHCPIASVHSPYETQGYASLLNYSMGYLFMGYSDIPHEVYRLKI